MAEIVAAAAAAATGGSGESSLPGAADRHALWATTAADELAARSIFAPPPPPHHLPALLVPRIVHHIWLGSPLPPRLRRLVDTWRAHHPTWAHTLWTDAEVARLPPLANASAYEAARNYGGRADVLRLEILAAVGGVYVDVDTQCVGALECALGGTTFAVGVSHTRVFELNNAVLAATAAHPLTLGLIAAVHRGAAAAVARDGSDDTASPMHTIASTGPGLVTSRLVAFMRTAVAATRHVEGGGAAGDVTGGGDGAAVAGCSASTTAAVQERLVACGVDWCDGAVGGSCGAGGDGVRAADAAFVARLGASCGAIAAIARESVAAASDAAAVSVSAAGIAELPPSTYDVVVGDAGFLEAVHTLDSGVAVVPGSLDLASADLELSSRTDRAVVLRNKMALTQLEFDYVLIDCPPSLGLLTLNALAVAGEVLILVSAKADIEQITESIHANVGGVRISVSAVTRDAAHVGAAHSQCRDALTITGRLKDTRSTVRFDELGYLYALYRAGADSLAGNPYVRGLRKLAGEQQADLFNTLEAYLDAGANGVKTAEILCIHRSTLNYRLERIHEINTWDLGDPLLRTNVQIALKLLRLFEIKE